MKNKDEAAFSLKNMRGAESPALVGVDAHGRLDGLMLSMTLRQTYRNTSAQPMEVVYTFPLPRGAVLLDMAAEFDGRRLTGRVLPAAQAEAVYEQALADGDAPILLEPGPENLYSANLGNLRPDETVTLELRFGQLLPFEQGRMRLAIPTTIAPRYGIAEAAGLQPHQVPEASLTADYPLSVSLTVVGQMARGRIECPTHTISLQPVEGGMELRLLPQARMDRDLVVIVTPQEPIPALLLWGSDEAGAPASKVLVAGFELPARPQAAPLSLRMLVDCSGSMGGDSIASAREALRGVLRALNGDDEASLSRFGNNVQHAAGPEACSAAHRLRLQGEIDRTDANMGGTSMLHALETVFAAWPRPQQRADVLLITDGEVWHGDALVASARRSGHRVFAIGVGSAPAESVLRNVAEATGGYAEFATPGEAVGAAAQRMLARMRQVPLRELKVDWGADVAWQAALPASAFGGDSLLAMARLPMAMPERQAVLHAIDAEGQQVALTATAVAQRIEGQDLARLVAARRLTSDNPTQQAQISLAYGLLCAHTRFVLVNERAAQDRVTTAATFQRVPSMLAAGWGATAAVSPIRAIRSTMDTLGTPLASDRFGSLETPAFLRHSFIAKWALPTDATIRRSATPGAPPSTPVAMPTPEQLGVLLTMVSDALQQGGTVESLYLATQQWTAPPEVAAVLASIAGQSDATGAAWLLLAQWIASRQLPPDLALAAQRLEPWAHVFNDTARSAAWSIFDAAWGSVLPPKATTRAERIRSVLGRRA